MVVLPSFVFTTTFAFVCLPFLNLPDCETVILQFFSASLLIVKLIVFVPTMAVFLVAVALYMVVDMGVSPYDALPQVIAKRIKKPFSIVRLFWDVAVLSIGFLLGGRVGLVTLVTGFCVGPVFGAIAKFIRPFFEDKG